MEGEGDVADEKGGANANEDEDVGGAAGIGGGKGEENVTMY